MCETAFHAWSYEENDKDYLNKQGGLSWITRKPELILKQVTRQWS